jgi:tetratricopeptide (TPR) repeat protein
MKFFCPFSPQARGLKWFLSIAVLCLVSLPAMAKELPGWFLPLREAIFDQVLNAEGVMEIYTETLRSAEAALAGHELDAMLSRCEYMLGRAYQEDGRDAEAIARYEKGIALAERSLAVTATAEGYEMLSANYGQACMLKSTGWVMSNGLKVEQNAKKALKIDPRNAACQYFIASRWVFGPGIFGNPKRGVTEMEAILDGSADLQKDDLFNVYSALGYGYIRLKKEQDALPWISKSLDIYPTNKFALGLLDKIN